MMGNPRTSISVYTERIISRSKKELVVWLSKLNIKKLKEQTWVYIFVGREGIKFEKIGRYALSEVLPESKCKNTYTYYKCRLKLLRGF